MITAPSAFRDAIGAGNRNYQVLATVTLTSGTVLTLDNSVIWASGFSFEDAISTSADSLDIGAAIINQATLVISNMDEQFSDYDFDGATVAVQIGLRPDEESSVSYINKGTFTVGKTAYNGTLITLTCLDNMSKFDKAYASPLTFPTTAITVVQDACQACGVTLAVNSFDGDTTSIPQPPAEAVTYRQILVWIGQMVGCCWRINNVGELAPVWYNISVLDQFYYDGGTFVYDNGDEYDGGTFAYDDGDSIDGGTFAQQAAYFSIHSASSESVAVDDTIVTGVKIIVNNTDEDAATAVSEYTTGTDGYVLTIEGNPLINADNVASILSALGSRLIGMTYRKGMVSHINDPRLEAGDVFIFTDHKGHVYPMICSQTSFTVGEYQHTTSSSETPARNSAQRYSESTRNTVKIFEAVGREKNARETAVEDLQDQIDNAPGLYMTTQTEGGATVYLLHNKPTVAASNIVWKMSSAAVGVSTNGGQSYNAGLTADGTAIVQRLYANAVTAGILKSVDYQPPTTATTPYTAQGMIVDLDNKVIRTPKTAILSDGSIYSSSVDLTGKITATSGKIGPWTIGTNAIYNTLTSMTDASHDGTYLGTDGIKMVAGSQTVWNALVANSTWSYIESANDVVGIRMVAWPDGSSGLYEYDVPGGNLSALWLRSGNSLSTEFNVWVGSDVDSYVNILKSGTIALSAPTGGKIEFCYDGEIPATASIYESARGRLTLTGHATLDLPLTGGTLSGNLTFSTTTDNGIIQGYNSTTKYNILRNHGNGNVSLSACSAGLYLGYANTTFVNFLNGKMSLNSSGDLTLTGNIVVGQTTDTNSRSVTVRNSLGNVALTVGTDGAHGIWSNPKGGWLLYANTSASSTDNNLYIPRTIWCSAGRIFANMTSGEAQVNASNGTHRIYLYCNSNGQSGIYAYNADGTGYGIIGIANGATTGTFYGHSSQDLALSGGTLTGDLTFTNNKWIYGKDTGGTARALVGYGGDGNMYFGYGSKTGSVGASVFDGNTVYIRANGNINMNCSNVVINTALTASGTITGYDYSGASHVMVGSAADASHRVGYLYHQNATTVRVYGQAGGGSYTTYTTLTGSSSSDIRLKKNVTDTEIADALSVINQIEMRSFDWLPGWRDYTHQPIGMIADQIEKLDHRLVIGGGYDPDGEPNYKVIDDHYLICYLTKAVQELSAEIKTLKGAA